MRPTGGAPFSYNGAVLLKAPTGAGKTIMAGTVAEHFATEEKVVWFWFAPFKGLVGQAGMSLRDHHPGLRVRDLATDRQGNGTRSGDTFILTWASVVARVRGGAAKCGTPGEANRDLRWLSRRAAARWLPDRRGDRRGAPRHQLEVAVDGAVPRPCWCRTTR